MRVEEGGRQRSWPSSSPTEEESAEQGARRRCHAATGRGRSNQCSTQGCGACLRRLSNLADRKMDSRAFGRQGLLDQSTVAHPAAAKAHLRVGTSEGVFEAAADEEAAKTEIATTLVAPAPVIGHCSTRCGGAASSHAVTTGTSVDTLAAAVGTPAASQSQTKYRYRIYRQAVTHLARPGPPHPSPQWHRKEPEKQGVRPQHQGPQRQQQQVAHAWRQNHGHHVRSAPCPSHPGAQFLHAKQSRVAGCIPIAHRSRPGAGSESRPRGQAAHLAPRGHKGATPHGHPTQRLT